MRGWNEYQYNLVPTWDAWMIMRSFIRAHPASILPRRPVLLLGHKHRCNHRCLPAVPNSMRGLTLNGVSVIHGSS